MAETEKTTEFDLERIDSLIAEYRTQKWGLIPLLQEIQGLVGYIPHEIIPRIASGMGLFASQVQGVITFYSQLYTAPQGKNVVRVCRGTACHVRGGKTILKLVKQRLNIDEGETTPDFEYSLETVACIGCCALGPVIVIDKDYHGGVKPADVKKILSTYD